MMHRTVLLGIGLLLSFFAWSRTIKGTVLDADDGESLPSFHVVLLGEKVIETYTDVDGNFTLYVPHDKPVHVRFQSLGFVSFDVVDIPNVKQIDLGKVYIPLNSYLNTLVYNTTDSIITQKIKQRGSKGSSHEYYARENPKKMYIICPNGEKIKIKLTRRFYEVEESEDVSDNYKEEYGLRREEFYYITYEKLVDECS